MASGRVSPALRSKVHAMAQGAEPSPQADGTARNPGSTPTEKALWRHRPCHTGASNMRLLLLNGNTDPAITTLLADQAAQALARHGLPPAEIVPATAPFGARYIATRAAVAIAGHAVLAALAEHVGPDNPKRFDVALIACFGEPGIEAARELLPIPVHGMAEASIAAALALLAEEATAAARDGAGAVVLGGAGLAGLAARLALHVPVPVLDSLDCALAAALGPATPPPRARQAPQCGLTPALARLMAAS